MSLCIENVVPYLKTNVIGRGDYRFAEQMESTNREAAVMAAAGAESGSLAVCDCQTNGRGRMTRSWNFSSGEDIAVSVIWRLKDLSIAPLYPLAAAMAVYDTLCPLAKQTKVKWPNDVLIGGKKVCGILCELHGNAAVIGIGVNVNRQVLPEEISQSATSLRLSTGKSHDLPFLFADLLFCLENRLYLLEQNGIPAFLQGYRSVCATLNQKVRVLTPTEEWLGWAEGIDQNGCLLVREDGVARTVSAGDVSVRGLMGYAGGGGT